MFSIKISDQQVRKVLYQKKEHAKNLVKILNSISLIVQEEVKNSFDNEQDPVTGKFWKKSKSPKTLQKTKALFQDMQSSKNYRINGNTIGVYTTVLSNKSKKKGSYQVFYGAIHNKGNSKLVQRRFAGISKKGFTKILNKIIEVI